MIADEGEESVCPGFASLPEGDKIIYARLGRLMPERRREEINFRGRGKIRGYQIKMNEHVVSYDTKKTDIDGLIVKVHRFLTFFIWTVYGGENGFEW